MEQWRDYFVGEHAGKRAQGKVVTLAGEVVRKKTQARGEPWRQNWLADVRTTWRTLSIERERIKSLSHVQFDEASLESFLTNRRWSTIWSRFLHRRMQKKWITTLQHIEIQKSMPNKTVTWNDLKLQRSKIVFSATHASSIKDQARHVLFLWKRSTRHYRRSKEADRATNQQLVHHVRLWSSQIRIKEYSKEVDVMESLQNYKNSRMQKVIWIRKEANHGMVVVRYLKGLNDQGYTQSDVEEFDRKCKLKMKSPSLLLTNGRLLQRPIQGRPTSPRRMRIQCAAFCRRTLTGLCHSHKAILWDLEPNRQFSGCRALTPRRTRRKTNVCASSVTKKSRYCDECSTIQETSEERM